MNSSNMQDKLSTEYTDRFSGVGRIYGEAGLLRFASAHACVVGIGGVGAWCAEALARSGIGELTLIDLDEVCVTNVNRQIHALSSTVGQPKVEVMAQRVLDINPQIIVHTVQRFFTEKSEGDLLDSPHPTKPRFDVLIDAIDHSGRKSLLIEACKKRNIPIVTCGAAGGRRSPWLITCGDLRNSSHDGLLRRIKQDLKKKPLFMENENVDSTSIPLKKKNKGRLPCWNVPAVFSTERPYYPTSDGDVCHTPPTRERLRMDCNSGFGSLSFVTATFGFIAVSIALNLVLGEPPYGSK